MAHIFIEFKQANSTTGNKPVGSSSALWSGGGEQNVVEPPQPYEFVKQSTFPIWKNSEKLFELYQNQGLSIKGIAHRFGCSKSAISAALDRFGIPKQKKPPFSREGGGVSYGKKIKDGKLVDHAREQIIIQRMIRLKQQGLSHSAIARSLNASGARTKKRGKWHHATVKQILRRENSIGEGQ